MGWFFFTKTKILLITARNQKEFDCSFVTHFQPLQTLCRKSVILLISFIVVLSISVAGIVVFNVLANATAVDLGSTPVDDWTETLCRIFGSQIITQVKHTKTGTQLNYIAQFAVQLPSNSSLYSAFYWNYEQDLTQTAAESDQNEFLINATYPCAFNIYSPPIIYNTSQTANLYLNLTLGELQSLRSEYISFMVVGNVVFGPLFLLSWTCFIYYMCTRKCSASGTGGRCYCC